MSKRFHKTRGYSLLELLVAFSLVLLIAVFIFDGVRFGNRVWATAEENANRQAATVSLALVTELLENAYPYTAGERTVFDGEAHRISFVTFPQHMAAADDFVTIDLSYDPQSKILHMAWRQISDERGEERTLLRGVDGFRVWYFDAGPDEGARRWRPKWKERQKLPSLIKLVISFSNKSNELPYEIIVRPKVDRTGDAA